jgi:hypothetical protein
MVAVVLREKYEAMRSPGFDNEDCRSTSNEDVRRQKPKMPITTFPSSSAETDSEISEFHRSVQILTNIRVS